MIRPQGVSAPKTFQDKQSAKIWGQEQELAVNSFWFFSILTAISYIAKKKILAKKILILLTNHFNSVSFFNYINSY